MDSKNNPTLAEALQSPYWREREAEVVLAAWTASGLSRRQFVRRHGLSTSRLKYWRRRLGSAGELRFHEVELVRSPAGSSDSGGVEIVLQHGRRVVVRRGFDAELLEAVVRTAESWSC